MTTLIAELLALFGVADLFATLIHMKKEEHIPGMEIIHERLISRTKNEITFECTYKKPGRKKDEKMIVTWIAVEPKTKEEKEEQERKLHSLYDSVFEETLKEWNQPDKIEERLKQSKNKYKTA